jgi:hypothetical protein
MPEETQPFTEKELEALAREQGKPARKGFESGVLKKVRSLQPEKESRTVSETEGDRRKELEDATDPADQKNPDQELEM